MASGTRRLPKLLKDLALALVNATLLLVAVCLGLAYATVSKLDGISDTVRAELTELAPVREELQGIRGELEALRGDLAELGALGSDPADQSVEEALQARLSEPEIGARLVGLQVRLEGLNARLAVLSESPDRVVEKVVAELGGAVGDVAADLVACRRAVGG